MQEAKRKAWVDICQIAAGIAVVTATVAVGVQYVTANAQELANQQKEISDLAGQLYLFNDNISSFVNQQQNINSGISDFVTEQKDLNGSIASFIIKQQETNTKQNEINQSILELLEELRKQNLKPE